MKALIYFLVLICFCGCSEDISTKDYVIEKMNKDISSAVRFIRLTEADDSLDLSKCHPIEYYRTITPPGKYCDMSECVAILYQEGLLFSVNGTRAIYFFDNSMLKCNRGVFSAMPTDDNYWMPATISSDGNVAAYECVANKTNRLIYTTSVEKQRQKLIDMGIKDFNLYRVPLIEPN